jgi:hypothetical protein
MFKPPSPLIQLGFGAAVMAVLLLPQGVRAESAWGALTFQGNQGLQQAVSSQLHALHQQAPDQVGSQDYLARAKQRLADHPDLQP